MKEKTSFKEKVEEFRSSYRSDADRAKVQYRSVSALVDGLQCVAQTRNFSLTIDEREALGGSASPAVTLTAGQTDGIVVEVTGDIDLCGFLDVDDEARPGYSNITADVIIDSPASEQDIQRLKDAVDAHCPVFDILSNATPVTINIRKKNIAASAMHAL